MYQSVIDSLNRTKTLSAHITSLGDLEVKTEDASLKQYILRAKTHMQKLHAHPRNRTKSTPISFGEDQNIFIRQLINYCNNFIQASKQEWQVLAERHGWTPPQNP